MKKLPVAVAVFFLCSLLVSGPAVGADTYPSKPINLWVGWGAGSGTDISQRAIATAASKILKQPVVVSNVTGGGGTLVMGRLKTEAPNGYTLATTASAVLSRSPHVQPVPYNAKEPLKDFTPIMSYSVYLTALAVRSDSPWKTFEDFIAYAKANPGKIRYSTSGVGLGQHLVMEYLAMKENIKWTHIPFTSSPQAIAACLGGHVEATSQTPEWKEHVDSGAMRLLVAWGEKRIPFYPKVPTLKEKGYDFVIQSLTSVYAPANTPKTVVDTIYKAFSQAAGTEEIKKLFDSIAYPLDIRTGEEVASVIKNEFVSHGNIIKQLGLGIYKK